jgi:type II secretory pathway component GspD/PulD (secretin)
MKPKSIALLFSFLLICAMPASYAFAQTPGGQKEEQKKEEQPQPPKLAVKLFEIRYRNPSSLANSLGSLGSGAPKTTIFANDDLKTLTVRDFPENIAAIEEALKRLDVPDKSPVSLEFQLHLIAASMEAAEKAALPKNLETVIEQLKSTLKFTNYRYISSALNRVSDRGKIESSGVTGSLFPTPAGLLNTPEAPTFYQYSLSRISLTQDATGKESVQIDSFRFGVSVPIKYGQNNTQYRDIGIVTPLSLREGEMAVVGTANIGGSDEAIIVVISVKKAK